MVITIPKNMETNGFFDNSLLMTESWFPVMIVFIFFTIKVKAVIMIAPAVRIIRNAAKLGNRSKSPDLRAFTGGLIMALIGDLYVTPEALIYDIFFGIQS